MMRFAFLPVLAALSLAGCFVENPDNGVLLCSTDGKCPRGYDCKSGACWKQGSSPPAVVADRCDGTVPLHTSSATEFDLDATMFTDDLRQLAGCISSDQPGNDGFFAVDAVAGKRWHFHVKPVMPTTADPSVYALGSCDDRACQATAAEDECGAGRDEHLSFVPTTTGRYIVGVDSKVNGGAQYRVLAIQPTCGNTMKEHSESCDDGNTNPGDGCDDTCRAELSAATTLAEQEPNDDVVGANVVKVGGVTGEATVTGRLGGRCDHDTYTVAVPDLGSVRATVLGTGGPCDASAPPMVLALYGRDGLRLGMVSTQMGQGCPVLDATQAFTQRLAAGNYSARVWTVPKDGPNFDYQLKIEVLP